MAAMVKNPERRVMAGYGPPPESNSVWSNGRMTQKAAARPTSVFVPPVTALAYKPAGQAKNLSTLGSMTASERV